MDKQTYLKMKRDSEKQLILEILHALPRCNYCEALLITEQEKRTFLCQKHAPANDAIAYILTHCHDAKCKRRLLTRSEKRALYCSDHRSNYFHTPFYPEAAELEAERRVLIEKIQNEELKNLEAIKKTIEE